MFSECQNFKNVCMKSKLDIRLHPFRVRCAQHLRALRSSLSIAIAIGTMMIDDAVIYDEDQR